MRIRWQPAIAGLVLCFFLPLRAEAAGPPPVITSQPLDQAVSKGGTATFEVTATSTTKLSYQWYFGTSAINGATASKLTRLNVTYAQAGPYWVAVINAGGTVNSRQATLTVTNTPPITMDDSYTAVEDKLLTIPSPGLLTNDTDMNSDRLMTSMVSSVSHGTLTLNANGSFTYTPASNYFGTDSFTYQASDGLALGNVATVLLNINPVNDPPEVSDLNVTLPNYATTNLVLTATDVDSPAVTFGIASGPTNGTLGVLDTVSGAVTYKPALNSMGADNFAFTAFDGSLYATGRVKLTILAPVSITTEPQDVGATMGSNITFSVVASGTSPFGYQWTFNGTSLDGATGSTLSLTNVQPTNAGTYVVVVTNILNSATSTPATLTVYIPPEITAQPLSQTLREGLDAMFSVAVSGSSPLSYQWQFNGKDLTGATGSILAWSNVQTNNAGAYTVVVKNMAGSVTSAVANLTVIESTYHFLEHWAVDYNGSANSGDYLQAAAVDAQGNVYVTGYAKESLSGNYDYVTLKYDSSGTRLWRVVYDGTDQDDQARALAVDSAGNVYVTGASKGNGSAWDYATVKCDSAGNQLWAARYNGTANKEDLASAVAVDTNGNVFVTGASKGDGDRYNYVTIKYDSAGSQVWLARYVGPGNAEDDASSLALDAAGNVVVTGQSKGSGSDFDYATIKYDGDGTQLWVARYNGAGNKADRAAQVVTDTGDNIYVTGSSINSSGKNDYATIKYSPEGNLLWSAVYDGPAGTEDYAAALAVDATGNVFVTGTSGTADPKSDYATVKYSPEGAQLWVSRYDAADDDQAAALALDPSGDVYVAGKSRTAATGYDFAMVKYRSLDGAQIAVARYNSSGNLNDSAVALSIDNEYNVYVAGQGFNPLDYVLVKYQPSYLAPSVSTLAATDLTGGTAVLNATVNPQGTATTWFFQYGPTTDYGWVSAPLSLPPLTNSAPVSVAIGGLAPGTLYHCCILASNAAATVRGQDVTFSTLVLPPIELSMAVQGEEVRLSVSSVPGATFTLLSSTNLLLPMSDWKVVGVLAETSAAHYELTLPEPPTNPLSFFRLRSP